MQCSATVSFISMERACCKTEMLPWHRAIARTLNNASAALSGTRVRHVMVCKEPPECMQYAREQLLVAGVTAGSRTCLCKNESCFACRRGPSFFWLLLQAFVLHT